MVLSGLAARLGHAAQTRLVAKQSNGGGGHGVNIAYSKEQPIMTILDQLRNTTNVS